METVMYGPGEWLRWVHRNRGPVTFGRLGNRRYAYLLGPEANAFVLGHDRLFRWREAFAALEPIDGPTSLVLSDGDDHTRRRALVRPGLAPRQVASYVSVMNRAADEALDLIGRGRLVDGYAVFRAAIRRSTMLALFGERIAAHADEVGDRLQPLLDVADRIPEVIDVHRRMRTPLWRRAMRARAWIDSFVLAEVARVRESADESETQVLATLVHGREGGAGLSDAEVRDQVVTLIAAGYETTSAALGWCLYVLGDPRLQQRVRTEVRDLLGDRPPEAADVPRLELLGALVTEALRLYSPAVVIPRFVVEGFDFAGRQVRPGTYVLFSPYVTHRSPDVYDDPLCFRPERWLEGVRRSPAEYLPFGGGAHRCTGSHLAVTEITVMLSRLLARTSYTVKEDRVRATGISALRPRGGLRIRLGGGSGGPGEGPHE